MPKKKDDQDSDISDSYGIYENNLASSEEDKKQKVKEKVKETNLNQIKSIDSILQEIWKSSDLNLFESKKNEPIKVNKKKVKDKVKKEKKDKKSKKEVKKAKQKDKAKDEKKADLVIIDAKSKVKKKDSKTEIKNGEDKKLKPKISILIENASDDNLKKLSFNLKKSDDNLKKSDDNLKKSDDNLKQKSGDDNLRSKKLIDDFPYKENLSVTSKIDLTNRTDSVKNFEKANKNTASKQLITPLERIKSKLDEQVYLKQKKPSDYKRNSIKLTKSNQDKKIDENQRGEKSIAEQKLELNEKKQIRRAKSLNDLKQEIEQPNDVRRMSPPPQIEFQNTKDIQKINIKSGPNMKANLSLGKELKAQVEDKESKTRIDKKSEIRTDKEQVNNNNLDDDWSSISISLDIIKDPKTKKIEINEDVKVLPATSSSEYTDGDESGKEAKKGKKYLEHTKKKLQKKEEIDKDAKKEKLQDKLKDKTQQQEELLKAESHKSSEKPSIKHYVKSHEMGQIKLDDVKPKDKDKDKFDRNYSSSNEIESIEPYNRIVEESKSTSFRTRNLTLVSEDKKSRKSENIEQQAVVLYKAENSESDQLTSGKNLKRMDILNFNNKKQKQTYDDSSSDEQTYEQIINRRNEVLKLHFPTLNISPPAFQPTPPPFHLKMNRPTKDAVSKEIAKSEELTYHEQKTKFGHNQFNKKNESNSEASDNSKQSESQQRLNYENIKRLDIPSEKVAAEIEYEKKWNKLKPTKETVESSENAKDLKATQLPNGKHKVRIDKKEKKHVVQEERNLRRRQSIRKTDELKLGSDKLKQENEKESDQNDYQSLIHKLNSEIDRLKRLDRYLKKVKSVLNDDNLDSNIKKSLIKRLILIKKDLNKLDKLCEQLLDKKYLINRRLSLKNDEDVNNKLLLKVKDGYSADSSEESTERLKESTLEVIKEEINGNQLERNDKRTKAEGEDQTKLDSNKESNQKKKDKDFNFKRSINSKAIKSIFNKARRMLFNSSTFKLFIFIVLCTLIFSFCYYKRNRIPKKFPCRLKRKL